MKKIKVKIVCAIVLLVNVMPVHCMFRSAASWRPVTSGMSRDTAARLVAEQKAKHLSLEQFVVQPKPDTSTLSGLFQSGINSFWSLFQRSQQKPAVASLSSGVTASSPFGRGVRPGDQKRMYSTSARSQPVASVPSSFKPSLMSMIPRTNENKIEQLFKEFYDALEDRRIKSEHSNFLSANLPWTSDVREFESLVKKTGYNPINRNFEGKPSFFAKMLMFFGGQTYRHSNYQYISGDGYIDHDGAKIISIFYKLGARWRPEEEARLFFNQDNYKTYFKMQGDRINKFSFANTLKDLLTYISFIRQWKNFFESIGLSINDFMPGISHIRWDYIGSLEENCGYLADKEIKNIKIEELLKNPYQNIFMKIRFIFGVATANNIYDLIGIAQEAGFFKAAQQDYRKFSEESSSDKAIWDLLPGLTSSSSKEDITKAFRKYSIDNHEDKLNVLVREGKITQEVADERKAKYKEITGAWNEYNEKLKQQQATE